MQQQIKLQGNVQVKSFMSVKNPESSDLVKFDKEVNQFLQTVARDPFNMGDKRKLLQSSATLVAGKKVIITIWYFDLTEKPQVTVLQKNPAVPIAGKAPVLPGTNQPLKRP